VSPDTAEGVDIEDPAQNKVRSEDALLSPAQGVGVENISSVNNITNATNLSVSGSLHINNLTDDMHDIVADNQVEMVKEESRTQAELSALIRGRSGYNLRRDRRYGHLHGRWREREDSGDSARLCRISTREALNRFPGSAIQVMKKELLQLLEKPTWHAVHYSSLSYKQWRKLIRSHMFIEEKFLCTGEFEVLKVRLVAGGKIR
jgi:hypothetical protein